MVTFKTTLIQAEGLNATGISVPPDAITTLNSGKKPKVVVSVNGYSYRSTVAAYGNVFMIPLSQEHRAAARVKAGDEIKVTLELDTEPRTVDIPDDLTSALGAKPGALDEFNALAYSKRKEFVRQVVEAKAQETRARRIAGIVAKLGGMNEQIREVAHMNQDVTDFISKHSDKPSQEWQVEICNRLREMVLQVIPDADERIQYGKPHYRKNNQYAAVISTAKGWVTFTIFNATGIEAPENYFEDGPPERKTIKILKSRHVDYEFLGKLLKQASDGL